MSISEQDMARVAELARIRLDDVTVHVQPMANPLDATQRLRDDEITEPDQRERFLAIAPATEDGLYLVPRVIE